MKKKLLLLFAIKMNLGAKLRKKLVTKKRFWKINAFQPKIKAIKGKTRKFNLGQKANWRGLVKELGCQIVTRKLGPEAGKTA